MEATKHNSGSLPGRRLLGRPRRLLGLVALTCAALTAQAGVAQAEQLRFSFHDGRINLGELKGESLTDPANPDLLGSLTGSINPSTGAFTSPPAGLFVPPRELNNVNAGGFQVDATATFIASRAFVGNYNATTGALDVPTLDLTALLSIYPAGQSGNEAQLLARCQVSSVPLPLSSSGSFVDDSDPDAPVTYSSDAFDPDGASVSTWDSLPSSTATGGAAGPTVCPLVDDFAAGPGSIWLSGRATVVSDEAGVSAKKCKKKGAGKRSSRKRCAKKQQQ